MRQVRAVGCVRAGLLLGTCLLLGLLSLPVRGAAAESGRIDAFHARLVQLPGLADFAARVDFIGPHVEALFDIPRIASVSVGRTWRELTAAQKQEFVDLLGQLVVATYAQRFASGRPTFTTPQSLTARDGVVVRCQIMPAQGDAVQLDYFFRDGRVFNVAADGVSDLSLRRADYSQVLKTSGFAALVEHLHSKIKDMQTP